MKLEIPIQNFKLSDKRKSYKRILTNITFLSTFLLMLNTLQAMEIPPVKSTSILKQELHEELIRNYPHIIERRSKCGVPEPEFCGLKDIAQDAFNIPKVLQMMKITSKLTNREDLDVIELEPGSYSDIIYRVAIPQEFLKNPNKTNIFVIKRHKWFDSFCLNRREETPQKTIQNLSLINKFIIPKLDDIEYIIEVLTTIQSVFYFDLYGQKQFLSIMEKAPGKDLETWISLCQKRKIPSGQLHWIMSLTGEAIGLLHYTLATEQSKKIIINSGIDLDTFHTIVHGDLNLSNIFIDSLEDKVYLIDAATMVDSLEQNKSPLEDLLELLFRVKFIFLECTEFTSTLNDCFENLIIGYAEAFPSLYREALKVSLLNCFKKHMREGKTRIKVFGYANSSNRTFTYLDNFIQLANRCHLPKDDMVRYLNHDDWTY